MEIGGDKVAGVAAAGSGTYQAEGHDPPVWPHPCWGQPRCGAFAPVRPDATAQVLGKFNSQQEPKVLSLLNSANLPNG